MSHSKDRTTQNYIEKNRIMLTTTCIDLHPTIKPGSQNEEHSRNELSDRYADFLDDQRLPWQTHHRLQRLLAPGGQWRL